MTRDDKATILIVDDEKPYLDVLVDVLQSDYRLVIAKTGEQGIARLSAGPPPDLILLDVLMPGIDGYETCQQIKATYGCIDIPLIFLTARDDIADEVRGLELGAVDYIKKPISPPLVRARIHTHLALRQARRELEHQNRTLEQQVRQRTESLRRLSAELVLAEEHERRRIAQALHDGPTQRLVLSKINLGRLGKDLDDHPLAALAEISADIDLTLKELRTLMVQLSPPALYELGLGPAVEWLAETILGRHGIDYRVDTEQSYRQLDDQTRVFLYHAIRELLINIVKHAKAERASIAINSQAQGLVIEVRDDGIGIGDPERPVSQPETGGLGLFALRDRIDMLGGTLHFERRGGTSVTLQVPITEGGAGS